MRESAVAEIVCLRVHSISKILVDKRPGRLAYCHTKNGTGGAEQIRLVIDTFIVPLNYIAFAAVNLTFAIFTPTTPLMNTVPPKIAQTDKIYLPDLAAANKKEIEAIQRRIFSLSDAITKQHKITPLQEDEANKIF